jgi:hypothetical protein
MSYAPCPTMLLIAPCPWRSALSFRLLFLYALRTMPHALCAMLYHAQPCTMKPLPRNWYPAPRNPYPATRTQPATRIHFLSDKRADIIELVLHGFQDRFKGIGFDFQTLPGEMVQGWNFIVAPVAHIEGPT